MKNVNYKSLKRFDLGTRATNPGYQTNKNVVSTNAFESNAGYDMRGDTQAVRNSILPSALTGLSGAGNAAMNFAQNYTSLASAASTNVSNAIAKKLVDTAGNFTAKGAKLAVEAGIKGAAEGTAAGAAGTEAALSASGSTVAKAGLNTIGKVASIAGLIYGAGSTINDLTSFSDRLRGNDLENMAATSTATKNGIAYKSIDGFNEAEALRYTSAQNTRDTLKTAIDAAGTGFSAGSLSGNPIIAAAAGVGGGLLGLLGGMIGSNSRKEKVQQDIFATKGLHYGANTQNESVAGSKGKRIQFYSGGADNGKRPGESLSGGKYGVIQTPSGPAYGEIQGLASPDEGQIDMVTGETSYNGSKNMNVIDRRADVIPVGITGYANGGAFDNNVGIPGHMTDINGLSFADNARPLFKQNEQLKDVSAAIDMKLDENENHKTRDKATKQFIEKRLNQKKEQVQQKYQQNAQGIADIVNRQTAMTSGAYFNCGKAPRYEFGKSSWEPEPIKLTPPTGLWQFEKNNPLASADIHIKAPTMDELTSGLKYKPNALARYRKPEDSETLSSEDNGNGISINPFGASYAGLSPVYGALQSLPYAIADQLAANKHTPYAQNSYVANPTAQQALNVLGSLRYDPYRQIRQLTTAGRQNLYNINNAGSLSAGQRAALASSSNIQLAQAAMNIYDKQQEMNNALAKDYATALMGYGQDEASRMQQANAYQQEAYRQAVGAKQKLQAQARKNWYTLGRQNLQDFNTWLNTQGMLDLWDKQVAADESKVGIKRPTTTTKTTNTTTTSTKKLRQKPAISKNNMTALPGETVADTLRKNNRMSYAQVAKIAAEKNISANSAWRHYMKYGNLNNL